MKITNSFLAFVFLVFTQGFFLAGTGFVSMVSADDGWKNFYGIAWTGTSSEHAKYAKQMGYDSIAIQTNTTYKGKQDYANLKFYFIDLKNWAFDLFGYERFIDTTKTYSQAEKDFYKQHMVWKSYDTFPYNLASGWFQGTSTKFSAMWDFQQQAVIDMVVEKIMTMFHDYEDASLPFTFAGYMEDEPSLNGIFYRWVKNRNSVTSLSYWTGIESGLKHDAIVHKYATYQEGKAAFFKKLRERMLQDFPDAKWIGEPYSMYWGWVNVIKDCADKDVLTPDMLVQEGSNTEFVDDDRIFNSGVTITKDMVGVTQPNNVNEYENRLYAAKAGINGAWYNWFGRFGGTGNMPNFKSITEVYPRLKLIRCLPNWDNLNNVPLTDRSWDGSVYRSTKSYASSDVMYSRQPKTGKLFAVFNTTNGVVKLNAGEAVTGVQRADSYFIESGDGSADVDILGDEIRLKSGVGIDVDATNGQVKGRGYIFTLSTSTGIAPNVTTGSATDVTSNSVTLGGTVNANGLSTTAWFEYGTTSGTYGSKSSAQGVSGSSNTAINMGVNGLSAAKTYYYRLVAKNSAGIKYGGERSFTTNPTTTNLAPNPGFETDPMVNYFTDGNGAFTWTADAAYTGSRSLKIVSSQSTGTFARWMSKTTEIGAFAGAYYTASVWMKAGSINQYGKLVINFWDSSLKYLGGYKSSGLVSGTSGWTKITVQGTALSNAAYLRVEFRLYGPGTLWIDDVTIK
ncbi:hypothetical protein [Candidatus Brocadia sinica]|uniref:Fibronectin type-III domain-containing protein n=1 Tax=Candidatus Brocadia sinica JPN1 TaxID=1197129 RepID=A0ABQ0JS06_9BACT|nr:hypothetical protein [Candidatus Brocadia sinica]GAN31511.1 hypothetical protein BROSI_A0012 [Candidatus Brocadia sinica JPN1]